MNHDEQLHKPIVDLSRGSGLQDEDVFVTDRLANGDTRFLVGIIEAHCTCDIDAETMAQTSAQGPRIQLFVRSSQNSLRYSSVLTR